MRSSNSADDVVRRLGEDEDAFLLGVNRDYGPLVYLPWPLEQYLVTDGTSIQSIYDTSSKILAFVRRPFVRPRRS